jgi:hypothetical protein
METTGKNKSASLSIFWMGQERTKMEGSDRQISSLPTAEGGTVKNMSTSRRETLCGERLTGNGLQADKNYASPLYQVLPCMLYTAVQQNVYLCMYLPAGSWAFFI